MIRWAREISRPSAPSPGAAPSSSRYSGRTPAYARSSRIRRRSGKSFVPSTMSASTSFRSIPYTSGSSTVISVVPRIATSWTGTMMSPSPGRWQRLITESVMRWLKISIVPLPGAIASRAPANAATRPAHAPAAETTNRGATLVIEPDRSSARSTETMRPPAVTFIATARWYGRMSDPRERASDTVASISCHGSRAPSGTRNARRMWGFSAGSRRRSAATATSSHGTPDARHAASKPSAYSSGSSGVTTKYPPVSSTHAGAMRRSTRFSSMHSRAAKGSLATYRPPECNRPWWRPLVPLPRSPLSTSRQRSPRRAKSRTRPAPVAPPPMIRTSTASAALIDGAWQRQTFSRRHLLSRVETAGSGRDGLALLGLDPVEGPCDGLLPEPVLLLPDRLVEPRGPLLVLRPVRPQVLDLRPEPDGEAGRVGRPERRRLRDFRPNHRNTEDVRLELHQQLVVDHPAVNLEGRQLDTRIGVHRVEHFARLPRGRLEDRSGDMALVHVAGEPGDHAARLASPVRGEQAGERRHEIDATVVVDGACERLDLLGTGDHPEVVAEPLDEGAGDRDRAFKRVDRGPVADLVA